MLKATPKTTTNNTTGIKWNDSYAANNSAGNIRKMVTGSEANPFKAGLEDLKKFQYNPNRPLYDNRDEMGYGEWVEKKGDKYRRYHRHRWGEENRKAYDPSDPTTHTMGRNGYMVFDKGMIDPHTGEYNTQSRVGYNSDMFNKYFANYLNAMG